MRWTPYAAALLITLAAPAPAQPIVSGATFYTLADLQAILVVNQQYFALDTEGSSNAQLNHLHFGRLDTTTGEFEGSLVGPTVPGGFSIPAQIVPVTGTITITPGTDNDFATGNFYGITFSWSATLTCESTGGNYTGAITFQGYEGSGKMHAVIAGIESAFWGACGEGDATFNPLPFSGQLAK
jgi:hypothetical protein